MRPESYCKPVLSISIPLDQREGFYPLLAYFRLPAPFCAKHALVDIDRDRGSAAGVPIAGDADPAPTSGAGCPTQINLYVTLSRLSWLRSHDDPPSPGSAHPHAGRSGPFF